MPKAGLLPAAIVLFEMLYHDALRPWRKTNLPMSQSLSLKVARKHLFYFSAR
jgi:hypothetical protein